MAEDLDRSRSDNVGKAPWLKIFTAFKLALDPKKLLLAAMGIFLAYLGWWAISWVFYTIGGVPTAAAYTDIKEDSPNKEAKREAVLDNALSWTLLHRLAGAPVPNDIIAKWKKVDDDTLPANPKIKQKIKQLLEEMSPWRQYEHGPLIVHESYGLLRVCPWTEYRGPNQVIVVSRFIQNSENKLGSGTMASYLRYAVEPLYKFLLPVTYFFDSRAGGMLSWNRLYLVAIMFWTIAIWGIFGGAITRMACVQLARNEKVGLREALEFVAARWQGYVFAPLLPLLALLVLSIMLWVFGLFFGVTFFLGDVVGGILWPLTMILGIIMAVILVGLLGWPLMNATISTEGSDSFDALSRSYSYVYQVPWHCLWYLLVSLVYGAVVTFFVGFMGSLVVYLGYWGVAQAHYFDSRDPAFLCVHAPTSFGWRDVLLKDSPNLDQQALSQGQYKIDANKLNADEPPFYKHTRIGTYLVTFWLGLFFLLILGFGYSFFWTAATIIYLLLRQKVDDTDFDEVYLEEDEDKPFMPESPAPAAPTPAVSTPASTPPGVKFTMVDLSTSNLSANAPAAPKEAPSSPAAPPTPAQSGTDHGATPPSAPGT